MQTTSDRSFKELFGDLTTSVSTLFRKEIELARAEASEKANQVAVAAPDDAPGTPLGQPKLQQLPANRLDRIRRGAHSVEAR